MRRVVRPGNCTIGVAVHTRRCLAGHPCPCSPSNALWKASRARRGSGDCRAIPHSVWERPANHQGSPHSRHRPGYCDGSPLPLREILGDLLLPVTVCEVCGECSAVYTCQECGKSVCPGCWPAWVCGECVEKETSIRISSRGSFFSKPGLLFGVAIIIIFAGSILVILGFSSGGNVGGCSIWPLPFIIVCGLGRKEASNRTCFLLGFSPLP